MTTISIQRANEILHTWQHYRETILRRLDPDQPCGVMRLPVPMTADDAMRLTHVNQPVEIPNACTFTQVRGKYTDCIECEGLIVHEW